MIQKHFSNRLYLMALCNLLPFNNMTSMVVERKLNCYLNQSIYIGSQNKYFNVANIYFIQFFVIAIFRAAFVLKNIDKRRLYRLRYRIHQVNDLNRMLHSNNGAESISFVWNKNYREVSPSSYEQKYCTVDKFTYWRLISFLLLILFVIHMTQINWSSRE